MSDTPSYSGRGGGRGSRASTGTPQTYGSPNFQPRDYSSPYYQPRDYNSPNYQPRDHSSPNFHQFANRTGRNSRHYNAYQRSPHNRRGNNHHGNRNDRPENEDERERFIGSLVHWSMTEDPWEKLRQKLKQKNSEPNQDESSNASDSGIANQS